MPWQQLMGPEQELSAPTSTKHAQVAYDYIARDPLRSEVSA